MSDILGLTSTEAVRAVWGISSKDIADTAMSYLNLSLALEVDLLNKGIGYAAVITAGTSTTPTTEQKLQYLRLRDYATYFCARKIDSAIHLAVAQAISDGNVSGKRFSGKSLDSLGKDINAKFLSAYRELADVFSLTPLATFEFASKSTPDVDPVTGT